MILLSAGHLPNFNVNTPPTFFNYLCSSVACRLCYQFESLHPQLRALVICSKQPSCCAILDMSIESVSIPMILYLGLFRDVVGLLWQSHRLFDCLTASLFCFNLGATRKFSGLRPFAWRLTTSHVVATLIVTNYLRYQLSTLFPYSPTSVTPWPSHQSLPNPLRPVTTYQAFYGSSKLCPKWNFGLK